MMITNKCLFFFLVYSLAPALHFTKTQRGRTMLVYDGFRYVINRESQKNTFWRCQRYVKFGCRAGEWIQTTYK